MYYHARHSKQLGELTAQHEEDLSRVQEQLRRERERAAAEREHFENEIDAVGRIIKVHTKSCSPYVGFLSPTLKS